MNGIITDIGLQKAQEATTSGIKIEFREFAVTDLMIF